MGKSHKARRPNRRQVVRLFNEKTDSDVVGLGGKGYHLAELVRLGMPVPPGFTVTTTVARAFMEEGRLPKRLARQVAQGISAVEKQTGRKFGDASNPLLVSVRSGAPISMPGMMDTVLNLGLNPETVRGLARQSGDERFAWDCYRRFLQVYGNIVCGIDHGKFFRSDSELTVPGLKALCKQYREVIASETGRPMTDDVWEQLSRTLVAVLQSWNSQRAVAYRQANGIADWIGTAVNVQAMVFGNAGSTSCTGVVFSRNVATGESGLYGEFLPNAQGEDVVAGTCTPLSISQMVEWNGELFGQLQQIVERLASHLDAIVDVEFTVQSGQLYILQVRKAQLTVAAEVTALVHRVWERKLTKHEAVQAVAAKKVRQLKRPRFDVAALKDAVADGRLVADGLPASPDDVVGVVAASSEEAIRQAKRGLTVVLVRPDTSPEDLPGMLAAAAIVTQFGGKTSHAAVVARGLNKPAVVGAHFMGLRSGLTVSVSGNTGMVVRGEVPFAEIINRKEINLFLRWLERFGAVNTVPRIAFEARNQELPVSHCINDFYLVDAMAAEATGTLAVEAEQLRQRVHQRLAEAMAAYVVLATAGELRYVKEFGDAMSVEFRQLHTQFGLSSSYYTRHNAQEAAVRALKSAQLSEQCRFLRLAAICFEGFCSCNYGGHLWADIARSPLAWLKGEMSASVFVDQAFDLHHNSGRMFGKHERLMHENGCESEVGYQLDAKRHCRGGVADLYRVLSRYHNGMSDEVRALYERGCALRAW